MIKGVHTMFYSSQPEELRAFIRDKLGFPFTDVGEGWLIFDLPEADMGCHPADPAEGAPAGTHNISFYCDDIQKTVAEYFKIRVADLLSKRRSRWASVSRMKVSSSFVRPASRAAMPICSSML